MTDAATPSAAPEKENGGTPPAPIEATPANSGQGETVTLKKEEHEQLMRDASRARSNQSKADRYDRMTRTGGHFTPQSQAPKETPSEEQLAERAAAEDRKAERGLLALASEPKYRGLFDADPTLRSMLTTNPLSVLPMLAPDALDAEDALALVSEALDKRAGAVKPQTPATPAEPEKKETPATPPAGGVNPGQQVLPNKAAEEALKGRNIEDAVAGSIKERLKAAGGRSS